MTLIQTEMIGKVKALAAADENLAAVLMYGSFIKGEGDGYSDIEFYLFYRRDLDHRAWVAQIRPLRLFFRNEFGTEVAIFDNLIRGEFHFSPIEEIEVVKSWEGLTSFEYADNMILVDKGGDLGRILAGIGKEPPRHNQPEQMDWLAQSLLNNLLMVKNLLGRGEWAQAQQSFQYIQKYLLWLIRLADGADKHWENPGKRLEREISPTAYEAYAACSPGLQPSSLRAGLEASLALAGDLFARLKLSPDLAALLKDIEKMRPPVGG